MSEQLQVFSSKQIGLDETQPDMSYEKNNDKFIKKNDDQFIKKIRDDPKLPPSESNRYKIYDFSSSFMDNSDEVKHEEGYESFTDSLVYKISQVKMFSLFESISEINFLAASTRFTDDIIFSLEKNKIFEIGAACLIAGIVASMYILPDNIDIGVSLLLSAPLFVCSCGIFFKHRKK